jgi:hypothetical protein
VPESGWREIHTVHVITTSVLHTLLCAELQTNRTICNLQINVLQ